MPDMGRSAGTHGSLDDWHSDGNSCVSAGPVPVSFFACNRFPPQELPATLQHPGRDDAMHRYAGALFCGTGQYV